MQLPVCAAEERKVQSDIPPSLNAEPKRLCQSV